MENQTNKNQEHDINQQPIKSSAIYSLSELEAYAKFSKAAGIAGIFGLVLFFLIIPIIVSTIFNLIWAIKTFTLKCDELKNDAVLWGILGLLILPIVPEFVMKSKAEEILNRVR